MGKGRGSAVSRPSAPHARVLLVDDEKDFLTPAVRYLNNDRFDCVTAESGAEALRQCGLRNPDVILLDLAMSGMDGFETFRLLRADPRTRDIPVILFSGQPPTQLLASATRCAGAFAFLAKPIDFKLMAATIRAALDARRNAASAGDPNIIVRGPLRIDLKDRQASAHGQHLPLAPLRLEVLIALALTKEGLPEPILRAMFWSAEIESKNIVAETISRLRADLKRIVGRDLIVTLRHGYKLL